MTSSAAFMAALGAEKTDVAPVGLLGLEHEYRLLRDGRVLDFRDFIHGLDIRGARLDPGDTNAYRSTCGLAVTCDDEEAEVASPPLALLPHFTSSLDEWAMAGRSLLGDILPSGIRLEGYSTHLSAAMPQRHMEQVVELFASTFAPALMMVLDRRNSHGVFVRPRPSRLELCGEYAIGERLRAAGAFFAGAARACALVVSGSGEPAPVLTMSLAVDAMAAPGRCGLEIGRHAAFGFDLYAQGRSALLPRHGGGTISAQSYLESAWNSARSTLVDHTDASDLAPVDRMVAGSSPLGIEADFDTEYAPIPASASPSPFGAILARRDRGAFAVEAVFATWGFTVFSVRGAERVAYSCIPRACLERFLGELDSGRLDALLSAYLRSPPAGRLLAAFAQTEKPGLWDAIGEPTDLLAPEPEPVVPVATSAGKLARGVPPRPSPSLAAPVGGSRPQGPAGLNPLRPPGSVGDEPSSPQPPAVRHGKPRPWVPVPSDVASLPANASPAPAMPAESPPIVRARYAKPPVVVLPRPTRRVNEPPLPPPPPPIPTASPEPDPGPAHSSKRTITLIVLVIFALVAVAFALIASLGSGEKDSPEPTTGTSTVVAPSTTPTVATTVPIATTGISLPATTPPDVAPPTTSTPVVVGPDPTAPVTTVPVATPDPTVQPTTPVLPITPTTAATTTTVAVRTTVQP